MGLRNTVTRAVESAFKAAGDLKVPVTITRKSPTGFNFATGDVSSASPQVFVVNAIRTNRVKSKGQLKTITTSLAVKTSEIPEIFTTDTFTIDGVQWVPVEPLQSNEFIHTIKINKV